MILLITTLFCFAIAGVSLSIAVMVKSHESLFAIINFLTMPLMFTSNAIFPVAAMPAWLKTIATWSSFYVHLLDQYEKH